MHVLNDLGLGEAIASVSVRPERTFFGCTIQEK
jgi:hypothetical protein